MTESKPIRVLIVDDHPLARSGLQTFILAYDWMELVGEAKDGMEAVEFCAEHDVDVVLMDLVMPFMDGSEATRRILAQGKPVKVIVLTSFHEHNLVQQALKAGATSYLLKDVSAEELAQAIQSASGGFSILAPEVAQALISANLQTSAREFDLTQREMQVLALLVEGRSNSEIADELTVSMATIKYHLSNIFSKLEAKSRGEAVAVALKHKLLKQA